MSELHEGWTCGEAPDPDEGPFRWPDQAPHGRQAKDWIEVHGERPEEYIRARGKYLPGPSDSTKDLDLWVKPRGVESPVVAGPLAEEVISDNSPANEGHVAEPDPVEEQVNPAPTREEITSFTRALAIGGAVFLVSLVFGVSQGVVPQTVAMGFGAIAVIMALFSFFVGIQFIQ